MFRETRVRVTSLRLVVVRNFDIANVFSLSRAQLALCHHGHYFAPRSALPLLCRRKDSLDVETVLCRLFFSDTPNFINDVILRHASTIVDARDPRRADS